MSSQNAAPVATHVNGDRRELVAHYGSVRSTVGSILFLWMNLSILLAFGWPVLVIFFDAPAFAIEDTPADWFVLRFGIALVGALLTVFFWKQSPVSMQVASRNAVVGIFGRGVVWTQMLLILIGVSLMLAVLLLTSDAGPAAKLICFGLVEAFAIQALFCGFVKSAFDALFNRWQAFLAVVGLFAVFFGLRSLSFSIAAIEANQNEMLALMAGAVSGAVLGAGSLLFRNRSGSLLPALLLHWTIFYLLAPYLD